MVDKLTIMAERMNLGKLTLHTAISYLDRLVITSHEKFTGLKIGNTPGPSAMQSKVITPRQRVINFKGTSSGGGDSSRQNPISS